MFFIIVCQMRSSSRLLAVPWQDVQPTQNGKRAPSRVNNASRQLLWSWNHTCACSHCITYPLQFLPEEQLKWAPGWDLAICSISPKVVFICLESVKCSGKGVFLLTLTFSEILRGLRPVTPWPGTFFIFTWRMEPTAAGNSALWETLWQSLGNIVGRQRTQGCLAVGLGYSCTS